MAFKTKLDFSSNRQVKQHEKTITTLSGGTSFGLTYSAMTYGPDLNTSAITQTISAFSGYTSTFSGNNTTTNFTWFDSMMDLGNSSLSAITPSNSATTQYSGIILTPNTTTIIDGNVVSLSYSGVSFDMTPTTMVDLGGSNYSGTVITYILDVISASTLDFTGRTIWVDVSGITRTEKLIITNNPQVGYVWTCMDSEGMGEWTAVSGSSSGSTIWTAGTGSNSAVLGGSDGIASAAYSVVEGNLTIASGDTAHAEGYSTNAGGYASHAEGGNTLALGDYSHAEGNDTKALGDYTHAEGSGTTAGAPYSHVEGYGTTASGNYSHAEGYFSLAQNSGDHAEGGTYGPYTGGTANGGGAHAEGIMTLSSNWATHAEGYLTKAIGSNGSHAEGYNTTASGLSSHAEGNTTKSTGNYSHAEGSNTTAGGNAHAEGYYTIASGNYSHAEGNYTKANGQNSHAEGFQTVASGSTSHAEGSYTTASGDTSHAEGYQTIASGDYSHAEGYYTIASGPYSHAEGNNTIASGIYSHAEGVETIASGSLGAHAGGYNSQAIGDYSFVHGENSHATNTNTVVFGSNITGTSANTVYVPDLVIDGLTSTDPIATDSNGKIVAGTSDARLKQNILELNDSLNIIKNLRGVSFEYTSESNMGDGVRYGFIAQEVQKHVPKIVRSRAKGDGMLSLNYNEIVPILVEAVKELSSSLLTSNNTHLETQTILAEDNNIDLNYSGTPETAIGGGIRVLHALGVDLAAELITDSEGNFITNNEFKPNSLTIPFYKPNSSEDINGNIGNITRDDEYLYIKCQDGWRRSNLERF
jgi:hypothetical protein